MGQELSFHRAIQDNNLNSIRRLLQQQPDLVYRTNEQGYNALHIAATLGRHEIVEELIRAQKSLMNCITPGLGSTALHLAAANGHSNVVLTLIRLRGDQRATAALGYTALHIAAENGDCNVLSVLIGPETNLTVRTLSGLTADDIAKRKLEELLRRIAERAAGIRKPMLNFKQVLGAVAMLGSLLDFKSLPTEPTFEYVPEAMATIRYKNALDLLCPDGLRTTRVLEDALQSVLHLASLRLKDMDEKRELDYQSIRWAEKYLQTTRSDLKRRRAKREIWLAPEKPKPPESRGKSANPVKNQLITSANISKMEVNRNSTQSMRASSFRMISRPLAVDSPTQLKLPGVTDDSLSKASFDSKLLGRAHSSERVSEETFTVLGKTVADRFTYKPGDEIVRIAVLDTGIDLLHENFQKERPKAFKEGVPVPAAGEGSQRGRIIACQNFCPKPGEDIVREVTDDLDDKEEAEVMEDLDGHGTQVAGIILRLAPRAQLVIARVCNGNSSGHSETEGTENAGNNETNEHARPSIEAVRKAVEWAISQKVQLINMSFGFDVYEGQSMEVGLQGALNKAREASILVFAATSNGGNHVDAAWPAKSYPDAIGIHSCDDMGKECSRFSPKPIPYNSNFMVVGENILSQWPTKKGGGFMVADGTSFATPVATSIAALILAFMNQKFWSKDRDPAKVAKWKADARKPSGMAKILQKISTKQPNAMSRYRWISPELLWFDYPKAFSKESSLRESTQHAWHNIMVALGNTLDPW